MRFAFYSVALYWLSPLVSAGRAHPFDTFGLLDWIQNDESAVFHPHQRIAELDDHRLQIYATDTIEEGEVLLEVPWKFILTPQVYDEYDPEGEDLNRDLSCELVRGLSQEMKKEDGAFQPYVNYLKAQPKDTMPSAWSERGKATLLKILGGIDDPEIPPGSAVQLLDMDWFQACDGEEELEETAALVMQKSFSDILVPVYDWYTHRNSASDGDAGHQYHNAESDFKLDKYYRLTASRTIEQGEPIHKSINLCKEFCDLDVAEEGFGTPEIFRDQGFVEDYPQRWSFHPRSLQIDDGEEMWTYSQEQVTFELLDNEKVIWADHILFDDKGRNYVRRIFRHELRRLYRIQNIVYNMEDDTPPHEDLPAHEWKGIQEYYKAIVHALQSAIASLVNEGNADSTEICQEHSSGNEGFCSNEAVDKLGIHYDDLHYEEDYLEYIMPGCSTSQIIEFYNYEDMERLKTNYQKLAFVQREEDQDICMNLETTLQICSNYRPHYHEFFVHFPARFLDRIERVIFIGGGDSMLLHEVLKYPTLQKVVGLELDQQVTRKSFKWFHSQPHWDDDRVEWWYGDATKSLPLLPSDYWGSFDLVLVDLSETVMSLSVTGELDIFSALSLLLKPNGIMVKNEPYIEKFETFFDYSMHIFYGSPKICTQVLVMGSNGIDFMRHPVKEHDGVEKLLVEPLDDEMDRFKYYHDYRKTRAIEQGKCNQSSVTETQYGRKAGFIELVEAEDVSIPLDEALESTIHEVLQKEGLTPISKASQDNNLSVVVLQEGYVVARMWPEHDYVALDINLWGGFDKIDQVKQSLTTALGSKTLSSYRVVVGGMFGSSTWETDKDSIGIQVKQTRNCELPEPFSETNEAKTEQAAMALAISLAMELPEDVETMVAIVVCGASDKDCLANDVLAKSPKFERVVRINSCEKLGDVTELYNCERGLLHQLAEAFPDQDRKSPGRKETGADVLVVDLSVPTEMLQVWNSVLAVPAQRESFLTLSHLVLSLSKSSKQESNDDGIAHQRHNFMERHRREPHDLPLSLALVELEAASERTDDLTMDLLAVGERYFFKSLTKIESALQDGLKDAYRVQATSVTGGVHYFDDSYNESTFPPEAYDPNPALAQAAAQLPLGRQCLFQMEGLSNSAQSDFPSMDALEKALHETIAGAIDKKQENDSQSRLGNILKSQRYTDMGDGAVTVATFSSGMAILIWDGETHVDINLFSTNQSQLLANDFINKFAKKTGLQKTLRDDQPRGTGRVVQFEDDLVVAID